MSPYPQLDYPVCSHTHNGLPLCSHTPNGWPNVSQYSKLIAQCGTYPQWIAKIVFIPDMNCLFLCPDTHMDCPKYPKSHLIDHQNNHHHDARNRIAKRKQIKNKRYWKIQPLALLVLVPIHPERALTLPTGWKPLVKQLRACIWRYCSISSWHASGLTDSPDKWKSQAIRWDKSRAYQYFNTAIQCPKNTPFFCCFFFRNPPLISL